MAAGGYMGLIGSSGVDAKPWEDARSETRSVAEYIMLSGFCKQRGVVG